MMVLAPVFIQLTAVVLGVLMRTLNNKKPGTQTQGEAVKTNLPCPNGVSG
jgi:hypothetical protein